ncbi:MAG TPA: hypothetical protein VNU26_02470, partial [Mycobacteriales bacterium]|nr:hypothetical protein [Mycobacteriales bacterium]
MSEPGTAPCRSAGSRPAPTTEDLPLPDGDSTLLLVVDQFEEVFTLVEDDDERRRFLDVLAAAA